jgi:hypothetical protein
MNHREAGDLTLNNSEPFGENEKCHPLYRYLLKITDPKSVESRKANYLHRLDSDKRQVVLTLHS